MQRFCFSLNAAAAAAVPSLSPTEFQTQFFLFTVRSFFLLRSAPTRGNAMSDVRQISFCSFARRRRRRRKLHRIPLLLLLLLLFARDDIKSALARNCQIRGTGQKVRLKPSVRECKGRRLIHKRAANPRRRALITRTYYREFLLD